MLITILLSASIGGGCHVVQQQVAQVYAAPIIAPAYAVAPVYAVWRVGEDEYQNAMIEKLTAISEQNQQIVEALRADSQPVQGSQESQVSVNAWAVLNARCLSCHNGDSAKGGVDLSKKPIIQETKLLIDAVSKTGQMPPQPAKALSDEEYAAITAWAYEDAKAVRSALRAKKGEPESNESPKAKYPWPAKNPRVMSGNGPLDAAPVPHPN